MALACLHCSPGGDSRVPARVRYHYSRGALGQLAGSDGYGERAENFTEIVYDQREMNPARGDLLVFETGEVLQVGVQLPPDVRTDYTKAEAAQLTEQALAQYSFLTPGLPWAGLAPPA